MPDLSYTSLANNWNRAQDPNSQYGTRRLQFFKIEIVGYSIEDEPGWNVIQSADPTNPDTYRQTFDDSYVNEYLESPKSILYPILRGVAQVGEIYISGEPNNEDSSTGPGTSTYIIVALSDDTVAINVASTSKSIQTAVQESIADFDTNGVIVTPLSILGSLFDDVGP